MRMNGHSVGDISSLVSLGPLPSLPWVPSIPSQVPSSLSRVLSHPASAQFLEAVHHSHWNRPEPTSLAGPLSHGRVCQPGCQSTWPENGFRDGPVS